MTDHHARAERLRDFMGDLSKVNEECLDQAEITLDGEIPNVPHRYAISEWDGNGSWINFADTLEDAEAIAADLGGGDYPWSPGEMIDLDTGVPYEPNVTVAFTAKRWAVSISDRDSNLVLKVRFTDEAKAREYIAVQKANADGWTVLDDEPIDTMAAT